MIGHSIPEYIFIRLCICCLRLVAPLSTIYILNNLYDGRFIPSSWLGCYALLEVAFYFGVYLPRSRLLQKVSLTVLHMWRTLLGRLY